MRTKFEYYIRKEAKENNERISFIDLCCINKFNKENHSSLNSIDNSYIETIIKNKNIHPKELSGCLWNELRGLKAYNLSRKKVSDCMSKDQWNLLKRYYASYMELGDIDES